MFFVSGRGEVAAFSRPFAVVKLASTSFDMNIIRSYYITSRKEHFADNFSLAQYQGLRTNREPMVRPQRAHTGQKLAKDLPEGEEVGTTSFLEGKMILASARRRGGVNLETGIKSGACAGGRHGHLCRISGLPERSVG